MDSSDLEKLNSKLKQNEEIVSHLFNVYKQPSEDPHDDRTGVSEEIEKQEGANIIYDIVNEEEEGGKNEDNAIMGEEFTDAMEILNHDDDGIEDPENEK